MKESPEGDSFVGRVLGGYRLVARLGTGAVGEVYRARDDRLGRDVAIKVLAPVVAANPDRLSRFEQESRAASALAHPNIIHIYDVGHEDGAPYIVMELVEGATLRQHLAGGPLPPRRLFDIAQQLAEGLAKAHQSGIVHRDLKPENILISRDGYVKIVDFGLAKLLGPSDEPTASLNPHALVRTAQGVVLGTAAYMSPEQAAGEAVDWRSDLFSFGSILYEMACGEPAFRGDSFASTLVSVIRAKPEPLLSERRSDAGQTVPPAIPHAIVQTVAACLQKSVDARPSSTLALARELRSAREQWSWSESDEAAGQTVTFPASTSDSGSGSFISLVRSRRRVGLTILAVVAVAATLVLSLALRRPPPPEAVTSGSGQLRLLVSERHPQGRARDPAIAPDGSLFAYVGERDGRTDLFIGRLGGGAHIRITDDDIPEAQPNFGPKSERLAFVRLGGPEGPEVCVMPVLGGRVTVIAAPASAPIIAPDGQHIAYITRRDENGTGQRRTGLAIARLDGSEERILLESGSDYPFLFHPTFSPDGRTLALRRSSGGVAGEIWLVPVDGGEPRPLGEPTAGVFSHDPVWHPDGERIIVSSNRAGAANLWSVPIDGGEPRALTTGPGPDEQPSVARDGTVLFSTTSWRYSLRLFDLETRITTPLVDHHAYLWAPTFTADGESIVFSRAEIDGDWQLWQIPRSGGTVERLTNGDTGAVYPRPGGDGSILFTTWHRPQRLRRFAIDTGLVRDAAAGRAPVGYGDLAPDGHGLAFAQTGRDGGRVYVMDGPDAEPRLLVDGPATLPRWSPDGTRIAFTRDRGTEDGIFVVDADGENLRQLTETGGWPVWWPDGSRIGFLVRNVDADQQIHIVHLEEGRIEALDELSFTGVNHPFDVAADGRTLVTSDSVPFDDEIWLLDPDG